MIAQPRVPPLRLARPIEISHGGCVGFPIFLRVVFALVALLLVVGPSLAAEGARLRGDIVATSDTLDLGDLVEGVDASLAEKPLFRAPALGATGTIQSRRIVEAAREFGLHVETGGRLQVNVTRAARRIEANEIEAAVKRALELRHGIDTRPLSLSFDGAPPVIVVAPEMTQGAVADEVAFDRRSRRVSALISLGASASERKASLRVTGALVELVEVAVLGRAVTRGETVQASDLITEKRVKDSVPGDALADAVGLSGRVARRTLTVGSVLRAGDLARPDVVARGETVTIVYESPGMLLTMRGRASEAGAIGDTVPVLNPVSKKVLQAVVTGPGKVSVSAALPGPLAANALVHEKDETR